MPPPTKLSLSPRIKTRRTYIKVTEFNSLWFKLGTLEGAMLVVFGLLLSFLS